MEVFTVFYLHHEYHDLVQDSDMLGVIYAEDRDQIRPIFIRRLFDTTPTDEGVTFKDWKETFEYMYANEVWEEYEDKIVEIKLPKSKKDLGLFNFTRKYEETDVSKS